MRLPSLPVRELSLTALLTLPGLPLVAQTRDSDIEALREQIRQLDQQLRVLERKHEIRDEDAATRARSAPVVASGASGFSLTSGDKAFQLRIRGNLHADARFFINDNVSGNDTFLLRRVRPSFEGTLYQKFGFRVMPDLAGSTFTLLDAYATYNHSSAFNVLLGKSKTPFDLERLVSQTDLLFIERSYPTSLGPNRDIGLQVYGDLLEGKLTYQLAWLNGVPDGGSSTGDTNDDKEIAARLFAHPFKGSESPLAGLGLGIAATTTANNSGAPAGYRTNAQQTFFGWRSGVTNVGEHTRVEPQAYYYAGPFGVIGSWASSEQEVALGGATASLRNTAWFFAAHYVLTGEAAGYRGVTPKQNFSLTDGTWGAFEVAARHGELTVDRDAFPVFANPATSARKVTSTTLGLNWYLNRAVKASLNYEYSDFTGGEAGTVTRKDEHAVLSRLQLRY